MATIINIINMALKEIGSNGNFPSSLPVSCQYLPLSEFNHKKDIKGIPVIQFAGVSSSGHKMDVRGEQNNQHRSWLALTDPHVQQNQDAIPDLPESLPPDALPQVHQ